MSSNLNPGLLSPAAWNIWFQGLAGADTDQLHGHDGFFFPSTPGPGGIVSSRMRDSDYSLGAETTLSPLR